MICSQDQVFNDQTDSKYCKELEHKLRSVISQQIDLNFVQEDPIIHKRGRGVCALVEVIMVNGMALVNLVYRLSRQFRVYCWMSSWVTDTEGPPLQIRASQRLEIYVTSFNDVSFSLALRMTDSRLRMYMHC